MDNASSWAWENYKNFIFDMLDNRGSQAILEIGGGRFPLFSQSELSDYNICYTVNDISIDELERAPEWVNKAHFDIAGKVPEEHLSKFDLMFSKMVFEHIKDTTEAYTNIYKLLKKGGICINFHPTLFSPPFVINLLLPEFLSEKLLAFFFRNRNKSEVPKFPAYYDCCFSTESNRLRIESIGFSKVEIIPFYGHEYFKKIPILRELDRAFSVYAKNKDFRPLSSYAFTIVEK